MNQDTGVLRAAKKLHLPIPGGNRVVAIGTPRRVAQDLPEVYDHD